MESVNDIKKYQCRNCEKIFRNNFDLERHLNKKKPCVKRKDHCKDCVVGGLCNDHGIPKYRCKDCGGVGICEHRKQKHLCRDCNGLAICEHGKIKYICKECGGNRICEHGKQKQFCKDCGGNWICKHGKRKDYCKDCDGRELCKSSWCSIVKNKKYNGYCLFCYVHLFPDNKLIKNYKTKETCVVDFITTKFPDFSWVSDKKVHDGCSQRRPDLLLDLGFQVIIVEIDEDQHNTYESTCENKRVMEISQDLSHRNIIFIRFNPDGYKNGDTKVSSCWSFNKTGIMSIKKSKVKEWTKRLESLVSMIKFWCENESTKMVHIEYLFYNICSV